MLQKRARVGANFSKKIAALISFYFILFYFILFTYVWSALD